jgi:transcriptional regulator with GAF, ATPase, and Fis domain
MSSPTYESTDTGLEVIDIQTSTAFAARHVHVRDNALHLEGMRRIARAFVENPDTMLQELVNAAVELCDADSAGISIEREDKTDSEFYHWVATAGRYSQFLDAILPREPSACGVCLERGRPQLFRVHQRFFDIMGIEAPLVTDGILLPWRIDETRGTIFIMAHERTEAFDLNDCRMMQTLADFASMGVRQQRQQAQLLRQAGAAAAAAVANELAHRINNPLQSLTNILYMAEQGLAKADTRELGRQALSNLEKLSALVKELLALPYPRS